MSDDPDLINREDEHYRRGVVLGLTMAEVTILLLFCLLLTMLFILHKKNAQIVALGGAKSGRTYIVSEPVLREVEAQLGPVNSQSEINDDFQKLVVARQQLASIDQLFAKSDITLSPKQTTAAHAGAVAQVAGAARDAVKASGQPAASAADILKGMEGVKAATGLLMKAKMASKERSLTDRTAIRTAIAGELCADQYSDPKRFEVCKTKIVDVTGGKGLEFQSCWWDKSVNPWRTKDIYDVVLTDSGFIVQNLDPGTGEYRAQKATVLPVSNIHIGSEIGQNDFLAQTSALLAWSDQNKCRFYVRVFDRTGPSSKSTYKERLAAIDARFYKELTRREFGSNVSANP